MRQVGDTLWGILPGAQTLAPTRVADVRHTPQTGFVNVHTLQGDRRPLAPVPAACVNIGIKATQARCARPHMPTSGC